MDAMMLNTLRMFEWTERALTPPDPPEDDRDEDDIEEIKALNRGEI